MVDAPSLSAPELGADTPGNSAMDTGTGTGAVGTAGVDAVPAMEGGGGSDSSSTNASGDGAVVACADADCVCPTLNVAVVGTPGDWLDSNDTAFQNWLSASTGKVDNYTKRSSFTFTADFLGQYNLIILAGLGDDSNVGPWWTFSTDEVAAFQDWIENKGGGVISLSGYSGDSNEITSKNALLAFSGIAYQAEEPATPCAISMCDYQCGNPSGQITDFNRTDPVIASLSLGVTMIGIDGGRPITAPSNAHVVAMSTNMPAGSMPNNSPLANWLVGEIAGTGRVLAYADECITYTSQWSGQDSQYANEPSCQGQTPADLYQTAQFWYNMIRWAQPATTCFATTAQGMSGTSASASASSSAMGALTVYTFGTGPEPCSPPKDVSGGQSGDLGMGPTCLRTADDFTAWNCTDMDDRTVKINNVVTKCGASPPAKLGSFYYFDVSAGATAWASFSWFCTEPNSNCYSHPIPSCGSYPAWVAGGSAAPCSTTGAGALDAGASNEVDAF